MSIEACFKELTNDTKQVKHSWLIDLSSLNDQEIKEFRKIWITLSSDRRYLVISRLVESAENSPEMDFSPAFQACLDDPESIVREKAIAGLWEFEDRSLIPQLIKIVDTDPSEQVRLASLMNLGKFAELAIEGKLLLRDANRIKECLLLYLTDQQQSTEIRQRCLESAAPFNTDTIKHYIHLTYQAEEPPMKCSALYAMGRTGDLEWLSIISRELKSPKPSLRYEAANACGAIGDESVVPDLALLLQDEDQEVQLATIGALGEIGSPIAKRALQHCQESPDEITQEAAQEALDKIATMEDAPSFRYHA